MADDELTPENRQHIKDAAHRFQYGQQDIPSVNPNRRRYLPENPLEVKDRDGKEINVPALRKEEIPEPFRETWPDDGICPPDTPPRTWFRIMNAYMLGVKMEDACKAYGIASCTFRSLTHRYATMCEPYYQRAKITRARALVDETLAIADEPIVEDPKMAMAMVRRNENRIAARQWTAERTSREFTHKSMQQIESLNVSLSGKMPDINDLDKMVAAKWTEIKQPDK